MKREKKSPNKFLVNRLQENQFQLRPSANSVYNEEISFMLLLFFPFLSVLHGSLNERLIIQRMFVITIYSYARYGHRCLGPSRPVFNQVRELSMKFDRYRKFW